MDYRWKVTNTGRRSPGTRVPMVPQTLQRNVGVVKSMLSSAAARPGFNPIGDAMRHRSRRSVQGTRRGLWSRRRARAGQVLGVGETPASSRLSSVLQREAPRATGFLMRGRKSIEHVWLLRIVGVLAAVSNRSKAALIQSPRRHAVILA